MVVYHVFVSVPRTFGGYCTWELVSAYYFFSNVNNNHYFILNCNIRFHACSYQPCVPGTTASYTTIRQIPGKKLSNYVFQAISSHKFHLYCFFPKLWLRVVRTCYNFGLLTCKASIFSLLIRYEIKILKFKDARVTYLPGSLGCLGNIDGAL